MTDQRKRLSDLPTSTSTEGLYTLGVDAQNEGVKIPLGELFDDCKTEISEVRTDITSNRIRINNINEELNGGDIIVNINKEVGIEDGWFELDSAIANVPARYKYRCGLFITFLWQRPADGEKVWLTYQFKGCDSGGEQEEQWQDTSRWNQMADVRFVVENAMSRCSALEDSQREQDEKIAANTAAIDNHEKYLELVDAKKASFINVHAELPDYFGEPGLIGNNIRNVAYTLSMHGDKYATAGIVVKFFAGPGWQVWRYNGGGMTDEANWTQLEEYTTDDAQTINDISDKVSTLSTTVAQNKVAIDEEQAAQAVRLTAVESKITNLNSSSKYFAETLERVRVKANEYPIYAEIIGGRLFIHNASQYDKLTPYLFRHTCKRNRYIRRSADGTNISKTRGPIKKGWHYTSCDKFVRVDEYGFVQFNQDIELCLGEYSYEPRYAINAQAVGTYDEYVRWGRKRITMYEELDNGKYKAINRKFKCAIGFLNGDINGRDVNEQMLLASNLAFFSIVFDTYMGVLKFSK